MSGLKIHFLQCLRQTKKTWVPPFSSGSNIESIKDDPNWTSRKNSKELIELSSINKVSLV